MVSYVYILQRLVFGVATFLLATSAAYIILNIIPGDIAHRMLGDFATPDRLAELRATLGVDRPLPQRYAEWVWNLLQGDLGQSAYSGKNVTSEIISRVPVTLELSILAAVVSIVLGLPAGIISALKPGSWIDAIVRPVSIIGLAVPSFWIGLLVLLTPSTLWNYAPPAYVPFFDSPLKNLQLMIPSAAILGLAFMASISRVSRTTMLEVLREDYVRTARAKGLRETTVTLRHALRNALIPVLTLISLQFAALLGGTVIIENIFSLPGLGTTAIRAINVRDYQLVQGFVVFMVLVYVGVNLLVDLMASFLDPRIRFG